MSQHGSWRRQRWAITAAGLGIAALVAAGLVIAQGHDQEPSVAAPQAVRAGMVLKDRTCAVGASGPFVPTSMEIKGVVPASPVLALARDWRGVPDVAPLTEAGKHEFAWDKSPVGIMPGAAEGNALFNAHTWPWNSAPAYGNLMLKGLHKGGIIIVRGKGVTQCYRVTKQVETPAEGPYPEFYNRTGPPQIAIIVCSGTRTGPGHWLTRTIWFASPFTTDDPDI